MEMRFGRAGWIEVEDVPSLGSRRLYVRVAPDVRGRFGVYEIYIDGQQDRAPIPAKLLRTLPLETIEAFANNDSQKLNSRLGEPNVDLSRLAASYNTSYGWIGSKAHHAQDWIANSNLVQMPGVDWEPVYDRAPRARRPSEKPEPLSRPTRVTDEFLQQVAAWYLWAVQNKKNPAPLMAEQTGSSPQSVHRWVAKARSKGYLGAASHGKVG
jgi:hypothetical protein